MGSVFRKYTSVEREACLSLFDENCPEYFHPSERRDYENFLAPGLNFYELCLLDGVVVGAFGLLIEANVASLDWILLGANAQGRGIGTAVMSRVVAQARDARINKIQISTSHKAFQFFEKQGAVIVSEKKDGWGPGMHLVEMELTLSGV